MTDNTTNNKFTLLTKDEREPVLMELTGEPFYYSTKALAQQGKRSLENARKIAILVVPA